MKWTTQLRELYEGSVHSLFRTKPYLNDVVAVALSAGLQDQITELLQCVFYAGHIVKAQLESRAIHGHWKCHECGWVLDRKHGDGTNINCKNGHGLMYPLTECDYIEILEETIQRAEVVVSAYILKHGKIPEEEIAAAQEKSNELDLLDAIRSMESEGLKVVVVKLGGAEEDSDEVESVGDA